jgi:hypothetical protein
MEFKDLPKNVQDHITSDFFVSGCRQIAEESNMIVEEYYYDYLMLIVQIVFGYFTLNDLCVFLQERFGINETMAKNMVQKIYSTLLFPVKDDILILRKKYLEEGKEIDMSGISSLVEKSEKLRQSMENNDSKINKLINKE